MVKGKIYKIEGNNKLYYGSTTQPLPKRFKQHVHYAKIKKYTSHQVITDPNAQIHLVEDVEVETMDELKKIEMEYIKNNECVNKQGKINVKENQQECQKGYCQKYYQKNKDEIKVKHQEYYQKNKDEIKEKINEYREKNKDKIKVKHQEYYQKNKDKIKEKRREYNQKNKDKIKEYNQEYREKNKDKIKEKKREYYQKNKDNLNKN